MPRILLVKTSSLGDVVHNLPVVADIAAALPDVTIDWVVEESFAAIPRLHPGVARVRRRVAALPLHRPSGRLVARADAGLAASIFHFGEVKVPELKNFLKRNGIEMRI